MSHPEPDPDDVWVAPSPKTERTSALTGLLVILYKAGIYTDPRGVEGHPAAELVTKLVEEDEMQANCLHLAPHVDPETNPPFFVLKPEGFAIPSTSGCPSDYVTIEFCPFCGKRLGR